MNKNISRRINDAHRNLWMMNPVVIGMILFSASLLILFWAVSLQLSNTKLLKNVSESPQCTAGATTIGTPDGYEFQIIEDENQYVLVCPSQSGKPAASFLVKKVGYLWALNWSLGVCFLFPVIISAALWSAQSFFQAIETVHRKKMLVERNKLKPVSLSPYTQRFWKQALIWSVLSFSIGFSLIMKDYVAVVLRPMECARSSEITQGCTAHLFNPANVEFEREYDWSISAALPLVYKTYYKDAHGRPYFESKAGKDVLNKISAGYDSVPVNLSFSTAVYFLNALMSGMITAYYALLALAATHVYKFSVRGKIRKAKNSLSSVSVMPDLSSSSTCKGFEVFAPAMHGALVAGLFGVVAMYLMRIQNLFLRADQSHIGDFFLNDPGQHIKEIISGILTINMPSVYNKLNEVIIMAMNDTQAWYALAASVIVIYVSSIFFIVVLRSAANRSRQDAREMIENRPADITRYYKKTLGINTEEEIRANLDNMKIWPVAWPNEKKTGLFMLMGIIFLTFYKLFPWFLIALCALIVTWAWRAGNKLLE